MLHSGDSTDVYEQLTWQFQSLKGALGSVGVLEVDFLGNVEPLSDAPDAFRWSFVPIPGGTGVDDPDGVRVLLHNKHILNTYYEVYMNVQRN